MNVLNATILTALQWAGILFVVAVVAHILTVAVKTCIREYFASKTLFTHVTQGGKETSLVDLLRQWREREEAGKHTNER